MRSKYIQRLLVYGLGIALLVTLGMRFQSGNSANEIPDDSVSTFLTPLISIQDPISPVFGNSGQKEQQSPFQAAQAEGESQQQLYAGQDHAEQELAGQTDAGTSIPKHKDEVQIAAVINPELTYEVTAYYLNVRANAYSTSKIINVVKKGTLLQVLRTTDNGWLKLKDGGYVHSDYARLQISEDTNVSVVENHPASNNKMESLQLKDEPEPSGDPVTPSSIVKTDSGLTEEDIELIFEGTALAGNGLEEAILEVEDQYGINALFTIAVMKLESGNGSSRLAKNKNNLFGLNATGKDAHNKAYSFETKGDSVRKFGQLLANNYVGKGYTTIEKVAVKYCPANSKWSGLVKTIMKKDYKKLNVI